MAPWMVIFYGEISEDSQNIWTETKKLGNINIHGPAEVKKLFKIVKIPTELINFDDLILKWTQRTLSIQNCQELEIFHSEFCLGINLGGSPSEISYSYLVFCLWKNSLKLIKNIKMWSLLWHRSNTNFCLLDIYQCIRHSALLFSSWVPTVACVTQF